MNVLAAFFLLLPIGLVVWGVWLLKSRKPRWNRPLPSDIAYTARLHTTDDAPPSGPSLNETTDPWSSGGGAAQQNG